MEQSLETKLQILHQTELALAISREYLKQDAIRLVEKLVKEHQIFPYEIRWPKTPKKRK